MLQFEAALLNTRSSFDELHSFVELVVDFVQVPLISWKDGYVIFSSPRPPEAHSLQNLCTFMLMDLIVGQLIDFWVRNTVCNSQLWTFYLMPRVRNRQHGILYLGEHIKESYQAKDVSFLPYIHMYYTADTFSMGSTIVRHDVPEAILQIVSIGHCYDLWPDLYKSKRTNNKGHAATFTSVSLPWLTRVGRQPSTLRTRSFSRGMECYMRG
uniref:Uncharacterized protein n=1 Tax=Kalanchoe fedtschenkoi TaxID=63787 RepID=A0A7N0VJP6_KALFE